MPTGRMAHYCMAHYPKPVACVLTASGNAVCTREMELEIGDGVGPRTTLRARRRRSALGCADKHVNGATNTPGVSIHHRAQAKNKYAAAKSRPLPRLMVCTQVSEVPSCCLGHCGTPPPRPPLPIASHETAALLLLLQLRLFHEGCTSPSRASVIIHHHPHHDHESCNSSTRAFQPAKLLVFSPAPAQRSVSGEFDGE